MGAPLFNVSLSQIRRDIQLTQIECRKRGLTHTAVWLAELKIGLDPTMLTAANALDCDSKDTLIDAMKNCSIEGISEKERDVYDLARSYFDLREYDRAAHIIRNTQSPVPKFLYFYSMYMSKEKKRLDNMTDKANLPNVQIRCSIGDGNCSFSVGVIGASIFRMAQLSLYWR